MTSYEATHAHPPLPSRFPDRMMDIQLTGLPGETRTNAADVYYPQVRRSRFDRGLPVNHLDVVSCWKGLTLDQASEIITWERILGEILGRQIRHSLAEVCEWPSNDCGREGFTCHIGVDMSKLVNDMMGLYFDQVPPWQRTRTWFASTGALPAMVYNFVRTYDCFLEASPLPCVEMHIYAQDALVIGEVVWQPPNVDFGNIPYQLHSGAKYSIRPEYHTPDLGNSSGARFPQYLDERNFMADSQSLSLLWKPEDQSFTAVVPDWEYLQPAGLDGNSSDLPVGRSAETLFTAISTMHFPGGVRYQRTSRYIIKLLVTEFVETHPGSGIRYEGAWRPVHDTVSPEPHLFEAQQPRADTLTVKNTHEAIDATVAMTASSLRGWAPNFDDQSKDKKRKAEKQVPLCSLNVAPPIVQALMDKLDDDRWLEFTAKRRRIRQMKSESYARNLPSHLRSRAYTSCEASRVRPGSYKMGSMKRTSLPTSRARKFASPLEKSQDTACDEDTPGGTRFLENSERPCDFDEGAMSPQSVETVQKHDSPLSISEVTEAEYHQKSIHADNAECGRKARYSDSKESKIELDQDEIRRNYAQFIRESQSSKMVRDEEEAREYESFFWEDSASGFSVSSSANSVCDSMETVSSGGE